MTDSPKPNRRDFLTGQSALDSIRKTANDAVDQLPIGVDHSQADARRDTYFERYSKNAMACEFEFLLNLHQYAQSGAAVMKAFELIDQLEDQLTVYRDHSEVSQLNRHAASDSVPVESGLYGLLSQAKTIFHDTNGAFDITSSPLTATWGFDQRKGRLPIQSEIDQALSYVGSDKIIFDAKQQTIRFNDSKLKINLGGIGKGYALDQVANLMLEDGVNDFMLHGGQSSVLARGTMSGVSNDREASDNRGAWSVGVTHPTVPGVRLGEVNLRDAALGTSGTARQGFFHQGKRYGHIVDPRTGWPTDHFLSTTVISPFAALSDALATAFFVMTLDEVEAFCQRHSEVATIVVLPNSRAKGQIELRTFNLSDADWRPQE